MQVARVDCLFESTDARHRIGRDARVLEWEFATYTYRLQPKPSEWWVRHFKKSVAMEVPSYWPRMFTFQRQEGSCKFTCRPDEKEEFLERLDDLIKRTNAKMAHVEKWKRGPASI